ncbi:hypothetical protein ANN_11783 [Periplaneta americana]|uniref:Uncharacterized protein n=1 Tax=Periplaneta americana TaxID=6978 RepID=A0ABQ8T749_PERAM|nr:hypothetical protein ANN_11783 [Periplaneta americana]
MAGICVGGNEPSGSLKAICKIWRDEDEDTPCDYITITLQSEKTSEKSIQEKIDPTSDYSSETEDTPCDYMTFTLWSEKTSEKSMQEGIDPTSD